MKRFVRILVLAVACAAVGASVSCSKKAPVTVPTPPPPPPPVTPPPPPPPPPPPKPVEKPAPKPLTEDELFSRKSLADLNAEKPLQDVFFEYDKATLKDEARAAIQKNAEWLKRWTSTKILIEGHCDARGTSEYNMALGERRAAAVRDYVASLGIAADRVAVVSKGKESPFCSEDNEGCFSQNRRGHIIISAK
jgi:peptidoglycan-associated lipoprotein